MITKFKRSALSMCTIKSHYNWMLTCTIKSHYNWMLTFQGGILAFFGHTDKKDSRKKDQQDVVSAKTLLLIKPVSDFDEISLFSF